MDYIRTPIEFLFERFRTTVNGLPDAEARKRLLEYGYNEPARKRKRTILIQLLSKFLNPLVIVLLIIAVFSYFFGEKISTLLVGLMALMSVGLSFVQEYRAGQEAEKLREMVRATATVLRNGKAQEVKLRELVPGDVVDLFAGDMIPADLRLISCKDLFVNQASLTGESFPVEKAAGPVHPKSNAISELTNIAFMGSSVVSGTALGLVVRTGGATQFGELARKLSRMRTETAFERGVRGFTWLMIRFMLFLVLVIFAINAITKGKPMEALLFSLAVAVGLTPEMLPMLVAINLSKGAITMARKHVIVKQLNSIQNLGAMNVLCTDKTGTLTQDRVILEKHCDVIRREDEDVLQVAYLNSYYQTGLKNLLDRAILEHDAPPLEQVKKVDEIPFDFSRRIMSVVVDLGGRHRLIAKGAPEDIFKRCTRYALDGELLEMEDLILTDLRDEFHKLSSEGFRVLAVAYKDMPDNKAVYARDDEAGLTLKGYVAFLDPPKPTVSKTIEALAASGVELKVLTGDNELVTKKICGDVGLALTRLVTGEELDALSDDELRGVAETANVFARLSPFQKERVIRALRATGHIVGYLGDGINDALSLKAADVGISVNNAVDIAKESADIILLKKNLMVLKEGVVEGRRTFANIIKYIKMGSSSNFGNMLSVTGASLFLPFLPMAPIQILLNNFLYDLSQVAIPTDTVDEEFVQKPRPWRLQSIQRFMVLIGPISSVFDYLTFGILWFVFRAEAALFHTGWFLESLCTQTLVIHVIRTGKVPFLDTRPSWFLILTSLLIIALGLWVPFSPLAKPFGFVVPPPAYFLVLVGIVTLYLVSVQVGKTWFVRQYGYD